MPVKKTFTTPYEDERAKAERQRRLAEMMQQQAFAPDGETPTYQGFRAQPSIANALSKVLAAYTSKKLGEKADAAEAAARQADLQAFQQLRSDLGPQTRSITGEALPSQDFAGIASAYQPDISQQAQVETVMPSAQERSERLFQAAVSPGSPTAARYAQLMLSREPNVSVEALMEASPESAAEFKRTGDYTVLRKPPAETKLPTSAQEFLLASTNPEFGKWLITQKRAGASNVDVRYGAPEKGINTAGQEVFFQPNPKGGAPVIIPGVAPVPTATTEGQAKERGFADRMAESSPVFDTIGAPSFVSRGKAGLPGGVGNPLLTPENRQFLQAERNFINATLRRESGATIQPHEFAEARQQYIPQPGDDEKTLEMKRRNRETVAANVAGGAGRGYKLPPLRPPEGVSPMEWAEMTIEERRRFSR